MRHVSCVASRSFDPIGRNGVLAATLRYAYIFVEEWAYRREEGAGRCYRTRRWVGDKEKRFGGCACEFGDVYAKL
jgi:hypothetical protein